MTLSPASVADIQSCLRPLFANGRPVSPAWVLEEVRRIWYDRRVLPYAHGQAGTEAAEWVVGPTQLYRLLVEERDRQVRQAVSRLSPLEYRVILLRYWEEKMWVDIARERGVSPTRIGQIHCRALGRLRVMLTRTGTIL